MLQLGRRRLCRLPSSYICASCLATSRSPSILSQRIVATSRHNRLFSTTISHRDDATPSVLSTTDNTPDKKTETKPVEKTENNAQPKQKVNLRVINRAKAKAKGKGKGTRKAKGKPNREAKEKTGPTESATTNKPPPTDTPSDDAQRHLNVLQGALQALKNVLDKQGVDVSQIPDLHPKSSSPQKAPTGPPKTKDECRPATHKRKPKPKPKKQNKKPTADATEPDSSTQAPVSETKSEPSTTKSKNEAFRKVPTTDPHPKPPGSKLQAKPVKAKGLKPVPGSAPQTKQHALGLGVPFSAMMNQKKPAPADAAVAPNKFHPKDLSLCPIETVQPAVPPLSYGLERVLFNPGVYQLQDPRTRVFNFDPYLSEIMPISEFDFNALKAYVTSSKDNTLISIAKQHGKKYTGSTSSMTAMLAHFHFLLSAWRTINVSTLSRSFIPDSMKFTRITRAPAAAFLHWKDGTYAIDADKEYDTANILSMLGKSMEKLLTLSKDDFERYRHGNSDQISEEERNAEEAFHYTAFQDFMMRSQLDAHDPRLPGTGMFDLKTRAVISIRMDAKEYQKGLGYEIRKRFGPWDSFEREYYDMIRSAFLKYSLQVRMGRMDGIFVAFHNTERIFGFHYIPISEMDLALHGTEDTRLGDEEFKASLKLMNELFDRATQRFPGKSLRIHFETRDATETPFMYFFAVPAQPEEIEAVQNAGKASIEAFERSVLGLVKNEPENEAEQSTGADSPDEVTPDGVDRTPAQDMDTTWQEARQMVEEAMDDDEIGLGMVREAIGDALEESGILRARSAAESREYVDALIQTITGRAPSSEDTSAAAPKNEEIVDEAEDEEEISEQSSHEPEQSSSPSSESQTASETSHPVEGEPVAQEVETSSADTPIKQEEAEGIAPVEKADDSEAGSINVEESPTPPNGATEVIQPTVEITETVATNDKKEELITDKEAEQNTISESPASESLTVEEEPEEPESDEEPGDIEDAEARDAGEDLGASSLDPLKKLIMRTAKRIDEGVDADSVQDDASKVKAFERILSKLMSQSGTQQAEGIVDSGATDSDASLEAAQLDDAVASEVESGVAAAASEAEGQAPAKADSQPSKGKKTKKKGKKEPDVVDPNMFAAVLTIKNKVDNSYVVRPEDYATGKWTVEYEIQEITGKRAATIYAQIKERRKKALHDDGTKDDQWHKMFAGGLKAATKRGRKFREREQRETEGKPLYMVGAEGGLERADVFRTQPKQLVELRDENEDADEPEDADKPEDAGKLEDASTPEGGDTASRD